MKGYRVSFRVGRHRRGIHLFVDLSSTLELSQIVRNFGKLVPIIRLMRSLDPLVRRLSAALITLLLTAVLAILAVSLILRSEFPNLIELVWLLRHDQYILVDIEEVVAHLLC